MILSLPQLQSLFKVLNCSQQTFTTGYLRFPAKYAFRLCNIRLPNPGVVLEEFFENDLARAVSQLNDLFRELKHRQLGRISHVHRKRVIGHHQFEDAVDQIRDVTDAPGLTTVAEHCNIFSPQRL
jgi:hypothetical protein